MNNDGRRLCEVCKVYNQGTETTQQLFATQLKGKSVLLPVKLKVGID